MPATFFADGFLLRRSDADFFDRRASSGERGRGMLGGMVDGEFVGDLGAGGAGAEGGLDRLLADVEPELRARSVTVQRAGEPVTFEGKLAL